MEIDALCEKLRQADPSKHWEIRTMPEGTEFEPGIPVVCFLFEGVFICDPFLSDCGGFEADPKKDYGLSDSAVEILRMERSGWKLAG
jgi:hypothetical protein